MEYVVWVIVSTCLTSVAGLTLLLMYDCMYIGDSDDDYKGW